MLFKRKKIKLEKVEITKNKMRELFKNNVDNYEEYNLVYAYDRDFNTEINDYIYRSLILGYNEDSMNLIIIETDKDIDSVYNIIKLSKKDFTKAIYNKNLDEYIIYLNNKKNDKIEFSLINENYIDVDILAFIEQEREVEDFKDFFSEFKRKPRLRKKVKN